MKKEKRKKKKIPNVIGFFKKIIVNVSKKIVFLQPSVKEFSFNLIVGWKRIPFTELKENYFL